MTAFDDAAVSLPLARRGYAMPAPATFSIGRPRWLAAVFCLSILTCAVLATFLTAPRDEDFWWTDGASFALNGDLVRDYLGSALGRNPLAFAEGWFARYPAISISLYPPIFPLVEAAAFAIFGFSHATAQATVSCFALLAALGGFLAARAAMRTAYAAAASVLIFAAPETLRWSRQIVMEIPALAFLLLTAAALLHYQKARTPRALLAATALGLAAVYTKQTALFVAPAFVVALLADEGLALFRRRIAWIAAAAVAVGLIPLGAFTLIYARETLDIAFGAGTGEKEYARLSLQALAAYGRVLPDIVGTVPLAGAAAYLGLVRLRGWRDGAERRLAVLMLAWFVIDYLLISVTADFEPRYATFLAVPPAILSVQALARCWPRGGGGRVALALCTAVFAIAIVAHPIVRGAGYGDVAGFVLEQAGKDDVVLFHGKESKSFAFSLRARSSVPKVFLLRAEKFLVDYRIVRDWGISDRNQSEADIAATIDRLGVSLLVFQPDFWTDQPSIAALQRLVESGRFARVAEFPIWSQQPGRRTTIGVYRVDRPRAPASDVTIDVPQPGDRTSGRL